ncbi:MAG: hypothetical protein AB7Y46_05265 [Armatimonadota bacterium]
MLSTYVYALLYSARHHLTALASPESSRLSAQVAFVRDPAAFSALARFAAAEAGVLAVVFLFLLLARLVDPWAGVAGAFVLALHPGAVALSHSLGSAPFCLAFLLCGLLIFAGGLRRPMRQVEYLGLGLMLGFATEALPAAWLVLFLLLVWLGRYAPHGRGHDAVMGASLSAAAFLAAALMVLPGAPVGRVDALFTTAITTTAGFAAALCAVLLLRGLRRHVSREVYPSVILAGTLVASVAFVSEPAVSGAMHVSDPGDAASQWITQYLPPGSTVAVHVSLRDRVLVPRTVASWRRELALPERARQHCSAYIAAAVQAADMLSGASYDVAYVTEPAEGGRTLRDLAGDPITDGFLVVPSTCDPEHLLGDGAADRLWLVARFRPTGQGEGITIWGLRGPHTPRPPADVDWHPGEAWRIAALGGERFS